MKKCPYCLAELHDAAIVCSYCSSDVMITVPLRVVERQKALERARKKSQFITFAIAGVSITVLIAIIAVVLIWIWNF